MLHYIISASVFGFSSRRDRARVSCSIQGMPLLCSRFRTRFARRNNKMSRNKEERTREDAHLIVCKILLIWMNASEAEKEALCRQNKLDEGNDMQKSHSSKEISQLLFPSYSDFDLKNLSCVKDFSSLHLRVFGKRTDVQGVTHNFINFKCCCFSCFSWQILNKS